MNLRKGKEQKILPHWIATRGGSRDNSARRGPREGSAKPPRHSDKQKNLEPLRQPGGQQGGQGATVVICHFWESRNPEKKGGREKGPPSEFWRIATASRRPAGLRKWKIIIPRTATRGGSRDNSARRGPRERSAKPPRHSDKQKNLGPLRQPGPLDSEKTPPWKR